MANSENLDLKRLDEPKSTTKFNHQIYYQNNFDKIDAAVGAKPADLTTTAKTIIPAINEIKSGVYSKAEVDSQLADMESKVVKTVNGISPDINGNVAIIREGEIIQPKLELVGNLLSTGIADICFLLMGDSTGNGTDEWFYLTMKWLASKYPKYTFMYKLWNDASQNYDNPVIMQIGSGAGTVTVLNASKSGANMAYSADNTRFELQTPIFPNITFISYSHNEGDNVNYTIQYNNFIAKILNKYPNTLITCVTQNPQFAPNHYPEAHAIRNEQICDLAIAGGYGLIDAYHAFVDSGIASTLTNQIDGTHPVESGSELWKYVAIKYMKNIVVEPEVVTSSPFAPATTKIYYYADGDEKNSLTGGWIAGYIVGTGNQTKNTDHLYLESIGESSYQTYVTGNKIDFTNVKYLYILADVKTTGISMLDINLCSNINGASDCTARTRVTKTAGGSKLIYTVDLTKVTGLWYIGINARDTGAIGKIYRVWSEDQ